MDDPIKELDSLLEKLKDTVNGGPLDDWLADAIVEVDRVKQYHKSIMGDPQLRKGSEIMFGYVNYQIKQLLRYLPKYDPNKTTPVEDLLCELDMAKLTARNTDDYSLNAAGKNMVSCFDCFCDGQNIAGIFKDFFGRNEMPANRDRFLSDLVISLENQENYLALNKWVSENYDYLTGIVKEVNIAYDTLFCLLGIQVMEKAKKYGIIRGAGEQIFIQS